MLHNINLTDFFLQAVNTPLALSAQEGWIIDGIFDILIEFKILHCTIPYWLNSGILGITAG